MSVKMESLLAFWLSNRWLTWGVGPVLFANIGVWPLGAFLEWWVQRPSSKLWAWKGGSGSRRKDILATREKVPFFKEQIFGAYGAVMTIMGPWAIIGGAVAAVVLHARCGMVWAPLSAASFFIQFVSMVVIGDFFLYWGHRIQHEIPFLNDYHKIHHQLETPTPLGAIFIDHNDAVLQGSLPMILAALIVAPHPLSCYAYFAERVAENVFNHSGLEDGSFFDVLFLKFELLGRAKASHHDSHHKFGGRNTSRPMNLGEGF